MLCCAVLWLVGWLFCMIVVSGQAVQGLHSPVPPAPALRLRLLQVQLQRKRKGRPPLHPLCLPLVQPALGQPQVVVAVAALQAMIDRSE